MLISFYEESTCETYWIVDAQYVAGSNQLRDYFNFATPGALACGWHMPGLKMVQPSKVESYLEVNAWRDW